ncbi:Lcl C-terminal domain-containing protein [Pseudomonas fluorescens group sp. PF-1]
MSTVEKAAPAMIVPEIGKSFGGGFFSGITRDPDTGKRYLNITAGAAHELVGAWGEYGEKIEGANSFTNSRANTEAMAAAGSELAQQVLSLDIGGFTDWAIPARDVQELQYRHFKPTTEENWAARRDGDNPNSEPVGLLYSEESPGQTSLAAFQQGGAEAFRDTWYWSSSQRSANNAFVMHFDDGYQGNHGKYGELRVRPVRSQLID